MRQLRPPGEGVGSTALGGHMQKLRRVAATLAVGAIVMAGCGGSDGDDDASGDTGDTGTSEPVATAPATESAEEVDAPDEDTSAGDVDACAIVGLLDVQTLMGEPGTPVDDT